jgi:hypothetical protein
MDDLTKALATLNPPLEYHVEFREKVMHVVLTDPKIQATAIRDIEPWQYQNRDLFQVIILHAINELQAKGSHAPLKKLPLVGGRLMASGDFEG